MSLAAKDKICYGAGAFGYGSVNQMLGNYLMFFGTGVLGLSGTLMGLAMALSTAWDAITDPLVGALSDRCRWRLGRRHSFIIVGCCCVAGLNLAIWHINPSWPETTKFGALLVGLLLIETFNTVYSTPYAALGFDMAQTYHERTSIQSFKTAFQAASLMVPSLLMVVVLAPQDYVTLNTTTHGYQVIALITSGMCLATGGILLRGTKQYRTVAPLLSPVGVASQPGLRQTFGRILQNKNNIFLIAAYAAALSCSAFLTTLGMHIFTYTFHFSSLQVPVVMGCLVAGIIFSQPLWCRLSEKIGKKNTVLTALTVVITGAVGFSVVLALRFRLAGQVLLLVVAGMIFVISAGVGCIYSLPVSMFADNLDRESTALGTGLLTFCTKFTNALVTMMVGVILDLIGFRSGVAVQRLTVCTALGWTLVGGVVIAASVAWGLFSKYRDQANLSVVS